MNGATETGVSFVVTVYNKAQWLPAACKQIADQNGNFAREYIFVDDGSTDGSLDAIKQSTVGWEHLTIHQQSNAGPAEATNVGISLAKHSFIKLVDADDLLHVDATHVLLQALQDMPECVAAYGTSKIYDSIEDVDLNGKLSETLPKIIANPTQKLMKINLFNPSMGLIRREAALKSGGCDSRSPFVQDYTLALRLSLLGPFVSVGHPIAFIPRDVPGRVSERQNRELQRGTQALALFLKDHPEMPWHLKQLACRRAAGRAWKYAHRATGANALTSRYFRRLARSYLPFWGSHTSFILKCAEAFDREPGDFGKA